MANDAGPEAKQWAVAAAAILNTMTRHQPRYDRLGGAEKTPQPEPTAVTVLANSWGIQGRDQLIATLEGLATTGNSRDYQQAAAAFQQAPPQQRAQDPNLAFVNQFGQEIGNRGLLAWDLGRMLAVAGWGYLAGLCSEDEAWNACLSAGQRVRGAYRSWEEYGHHYRLGLLFWDAGSVGQLDQILGQLAAPNSPWKLIPWSLDGAAALPGFPSVPGAPPVGAPPGYGPPPGVLSPPAGGSPGGYGPPPGAPGGPANYGGVPVIAPPPGGAGPMPGGPGIAGASGKGKGLVLAVIAGGGLLFLIVVIALVVHFRHKSEAEAQHETPHETPREPSRPHEGKRGKH